MNRQLVQYAPEDFSLKLFTKQSNTRGTFRPVLVIVWISEGMNLKYLGLNKNIDFLSASSVDQRHECKVPQD